MDRITGFLDNPTGLVQLSFCDRIPASSLQQYVVVDCPSNSSVAGSTNDEAESGCRRSQEKTGTVVRACA